MLTALNQRIESASKITLNLGIRLSSHLFCADAEATGLSRHLLQVDSVKMTIAQDATTTFGITTELETTLFISTTAYATEPGTTAYATEPGTTAYVTDPDTTNVNTHPSGKMGDFEVDEVTPAYGGAATYSSDAQNPGASATLSSCVLLPATLPWNWIILSPYPCISFLL
jgi:hypothetical protein